MPFQFRRLLRPSNILCALLAGIILAYAVPVAAVLYAKWKIRNSPELWVVPKPLGTISPAASTGRTFSYFGYEFESPWTDLKLERKFNSIVILNFSSGQFISILNPAQQVNELEIMQQESAKRGEDIRVTFGGEIVRSRYTLQSWVWNLTPADARLSWSARKMVNNSIFLSMKKAWVSRIKGGLYSFETSRFRGFQEGGPALADAVMIRGYDHQDRMVELLIGTERGSNNRPSQAEINAILYSLRPVPSAPGK